MAKTKEYEIKVNYNSDECILGMVELEQVSFKFSGYWVKSKKKGQDDFLSVKFGTYTENKKDKKWYSDVCINDRDLYKALVEDITELFNE